MKDLRWTRKAESSYLVLSNNGKLYHAVDDSPPRHVMDGVDAVEWSVTGNSVAIARECNLGILSSRFVEKLSIPLSYKTWIGDSGGNCIVKGGFVLIA